MACSEICVIPITSEPNVRDLVSTLVNLPTSPPSLYLNAEGIQSGPNGRISKIVLLAPPESAIYVIDIRRLGSLAFSTPGADNQTLKSILESESIPKVFFDVRNTSAALFNQHEISLGRVHEIQLMELGTRKEDAKKAYLAGLDKCTANSENRGVASGFLVYQFDTRILQFPRLWKKYHEALCRVGQAFWVSMVRDAIKNRVRLSQSMTYDGENAGNSRSPWYGVNIEDLIEDWNEDVIDQAKGGDLWIDYNSFKAL